METELNESTTPAVDASSSGSRQERVVMRQPITCDQVAWLLDIADRYLPPQKTPRVCQQRELQKYAMLYEIMDIAGLRFADDSARLNGTPNQARKYDKDA